MARAPAQLIKTNDPSVILDVLLEDRVLVFALINLSDMAVRDVSVSFSRAVTGLGGETDIGKLPVFQKLTYLAPRKTIRVPLDRAEIFYRNNRSSVLTVTVAYRTAKGRFEGKIRHNLAVYRNFPDVTVE